MPSRLSGFALLLAAAALGVAAYALFQDRSGPTSADDRLAALEDRLARMEVTLAAREPSREQAPSLLGRSLADAPPTGSAARAAPEDGPEATGPGGSKLPGTEDPEEASEQLQALIDEAVERKAAQFQQMRNKKPTIDVFARTLELSDPQRQAVEREVLGAQREIQAILETPAADGTNFLDELVEVLADGIARPGQKTGRGMKLFGRLMTEKIPGSDETYAGRVEGVKQGLRATFKRNWSPKQFAAFHAWEMDPTEIKEIEGSPWKDVEARVIERAKALGAEMPTGG